MTFGRALLAMIVPALLIGPLLGAIGAAALVFGTGLANGFAPDSSAFTLLALAIAMVIGLIVASPIALLFGASGLMLAQRDHRRQSLRRWIATGAVPGALAGCAVAIWAGSDFGSEREIGLYAILVVAGAVLGAIGGWLARRMLAGRIAGFDTIDDPILA